MAVARQRICLPKGAWTGSLGAMVRGDLWEGDEIARLEESFAEFIGVPAAAAIASARAGLRFLLEALDLPNGSQIICSAFGYPVVPHIAKSMGFELGLVDCELQTLGMDPDALAETITDHTSAVIPTHLYGVPCRIRELAEICDAHGAALIEDAAHCYGASVDGRKAGAWGRAAYFSFETSKMINTMGGGMVTTQEPEIAEQIRAADRAQPPKNLGWLGKRLTKTSFEATVTNPLFFNLGVYQALRMAAGREEPEKQEDESRFSSGYYSDEVSMAGKMGRYTNFQARLGREQMERIGPQWERRQENAERLMARLGDQVHLQRPAADDVVANYMLVTALFPNMREVAAELLRRGVDTKHHYMRDCKRIFDVPGEFPNASRCEDEVLHLPAYPQLSTKRIDEIATKVLEVADKLG